MIDACPSNNYGRPGEGMCNAYLLVFHARKSLTIHCRIFDRLSAADVSMKFLLTSWSKRYLRGEDKDCEAGFWKDGFGIKSFEEKKIQD